MNNAMHQSVSHNSKVFDFSAVTGVHLTDIPPVYQERESSLTALPAVLDMDIPRRVLEPFRVRANELEIVASGIVVTTDAEQAKATSLAGQIKKVVKTIEEARKRYVTPFNEHVKGVNGLAGEIRQPLERAELMLKKSLTIYATEQELVRRKAEEDARKTAEEQQQRLNEEAASAGIVAPIVPEILQTDVTTTVRTTDGTSYMRSTWDFEIVDMSTVPVEYLCPNETKIRAAIRAGIRSIPGMRILEKHTVAIRS